MPDETIFPTATPDMLRRRARLLQQVRQFFDERGFFEVQTPTVCSDTIVDAYLDPPHLEGRKWLLPEHAKAANYYLQTSPEFAMKRLLVAGCEAIYQIGPAFRAGERGCKHNPEFTMLEWYRVGDSMADAVDLVDAFSQAILNTGPCQRRSYRDLFREVLQIDVMVAPTVELVDGVAKHDADLAERLREDRDGLLDALFSFAIEPSFAGSPQIVTDYPASQAALAQLTPENSQCAERFEWFAGGLELGNGYGELRDANVLHERMEANQQKRVASGREPLPTTSQLEAAMRVGLPPCAGVAVGFDRLAMAALGAERIDDVLCFPIERA